MKNRDIFNSALNMLAQKSDTGENEDYEERAPYLIASFCNEVAHIDKLMREVLGIDTRQTFERLWLSLEDDFPLLERFVSVAAAYLAAMLIIDEDGELSDKLYEMYCDGISIIRNELPYAIEKIVDKYL